MIQNTVVTRETHPIHCAVLFVTIRHNLAICLELPWLSFKEKGQAMPGSWASDQKCHTLFSAHIPLKKPYQNDVSKLRWSEMYMSFLWTQALLQQAQIAGGYE